MTQQQELIPVVTPWLEPVPEDEASPAAAAAMAALNDQRHALFREHALKAIYFTYPWLLSLLALMKGQVVACQGRLMIFTPEAPGQFIEIPELSRQLCLLPWQEDGQTPQ